MEDEKIKDLFKKFQPDLSSDTIFMSTLKKNMESVELVKLHHAKLRHRNKIAIAVAAFSGFAMGALMTLLMPRIVNRLSTITLPDFFPAQISVDWNIMAWIVTSAICGIVAFNAYEITISKLSYKDIYANPTS